MPHDKASDTDFVKLLLEHSPDATIVTAIDGQTLYWGRGAESLFGYHESEALGRRLVELIVPEFLLGDEERALAETLTRGQSTRESIRRAKSGSLIHVDVSRRAVRGDHGAPEVVVSVEKDVTDLKASRDARLVEARFGNLLESVPDAIVMVNSTGRIVSANAHAGRMFGYEPQRLLALRIEELLPQRHRASHIGHRVDFFAQPRTRAMGAGLELFGLRRDGTEFPVEISLSPMPTEEGGLLVMSAIRDTSERKRFEDQLREKNAELERANQAKNRFLAAMSHELRTPLNAVIGFTGTLLMELPGPLLPEQKQQLRTVQSSARHLLSLINDLLDVARIEAGRIDLKPEATRCADVIEEVVGSLAPLAQARGLRVSIEAADPELSLVVDRRALRQIVLNLINNALKFTERGGVSVAVRRVAHGDRSMVEIAVADTGIGISSEDRLKLFAAFSQFDHVRRRPSEGTGLGLHLSQKLAEALRGRIEVDSEVGAGSTFTLVLPLA
ncbi:MAG TPA: PAS domain S-box protein [Burkholderiaceae bacterium]|nr:PAS domain S-box protein [Burkholderiaceae bacterium]